MNEEERQAQFNQLFMESFPEPLPLKLSEQKCPLHGFYLISYPRDRDANSYGYSFKCALKNCGFGEPEAN